MEEAKQAISKQDAEREKAEKAQVSAQGLVLEFQAAIAEARGTCSHLALKRRGGGRGRPGWHPNWTLLKARYVTFQAEMSLVEQRLIQEARAVFCTLTKNYMATELRDQRFNAVVVDEISMALPPLIFLAAARATDGAWFSLAIPSTPTDRAQRLPGQQRPASAGHVSSCWGRDRLASGH